MSGQEACCFAHSTKTVTARDGDHTPLTSGAATPASKNGGKLTVYFGRFFYQPDGRIPTAVGKQPPARRMELRAPAAQNLKFFRFRLNLPIVENHSLAL
jgi:hypothetical protein